MAEPAAMETSPAPVLLDFSRPNKKRNYIRRVRAESSDTEITPNTSATTTVTATPASSSIPSAPVLATASTIPKDSTSDAEADQPTNLAEILRRRKKQTRPKQGLDIAEIVPKIACRDAEAEMPDAENEAAKDAAEQELAAVVNRFTHQTGHVLDVDKHMVAYIESQMEKRRLLNSSLNAVDSTTTPTDSSSYPSNSPTNKSAFWQPTRPADRGATLGKLHEVDLGEENKLKNIHRTQEATRRLEGGEIEDVNMDGGDAGGKKGRRRRRRNSQDIQRDKLVEEVLKESKLELYDEPGSDNGHPSDEEGAADDRIAEKFRREFLDALMSRRRRRGNYQKTKKKDDAKKPRGPKLGGSRSARAAMRESQLAASGGASASGGIRK